MTGEATMVIIKPDAIQRGLTGPALAKLEEAKLSMVGAKVMRVSRQLAEEHYNALKDKHFFQDLLKHICGELHGTDHVLVFVYVGEGAITKIRQLAGATNPEKADPKSIRGAYGRNTASGIMENVLHASSDREEAEREIKLWFRPDELLVALYPTKMVKGDVAVWAS